MKEPAYVANVTRALSSRAGWTGKGGRSGALKNLQSNFYQGIPLFTKTPGI